MLRVYRPTPRPFKRPPPAGVQTLAFGLVHGRLESTPGPGHLRQCLQVRPEANGQAGQQGGTPGSRLLHSTDLDRNAQLVCLELHQQQALDK